MTQMMLILAALVLSFTFRRRPAAVLGTALILTFLVPISLQSTYFPGLHPAIVLILVFAGLYYLDGSPRSLGIAPALQVVLMVLAMLSIPSLSALSGALRLSVSIVLAPAAFVSVAVTAQRRGHGALPNQLAKTLMALTLINVIFATMQQVVDGPILFTEINESYYEWGVTSSGRRAGMLGNPLELGLACACAVPLLGRYRGPFLRYGLLLVLLAGCVLAQARSALVVATALSMYLLWTDRRRVPVVILPMAALASVSAYFVTSLGLLTQVSGRFYNSSTTDGFRFSAYNWFFRHIHQFLLLGKGPYADPRLTGQLVSSLENAYFVLAYGFGALFGLTLFISHLICARRLGLAHLVQWRAYLWSHSSD